MQIPRAVAAMGRGRESEGNNAWIEFVVPRAEVVVNMGVAMTEDQSPQSLSEGSSLWESVQQELERVAQAHNIPRQDQDHANAGASRLSSRQIISNAAAYLQRSLLTAEIDEEDGELRRRVENASRASQAMWFRLEEMAHQRGDLEAPQASLAPSSVQDGLRDGTTNERQSSVPGRTPTSEVDNFRLPFERVGWDHGVDASGMWGGTRILYA